MNKNKEHVKKVSNFIVETLEGLLEKIEIDFSLDVLYDNEIKAIRFLIKTDESNVLIGNKGVNLSAFSHIVKRIVDKKFDNSGEDRIYFIIDVNNYQGSKIEDLKTNAHMLAQRAKYFKNDVQMDPIPPYDRMVVHSLFADSKDFNTTSEGEGDKRRIVIRYVGE